MPLGKQADILAVPAAWRGDGAGAGHLLPALPRGYPAHDGGRHHLHPGAAPAQGRWPAILGIPWLSNEPEQPNDPNEARLAVLLAAIESHCSTGAAPLPTAASMLAPDGRSFAQWRSELDALASAHEAGCYRERLVDFDALLEVARDHRLEAALRAGAFYVLLSGGPEEHKTRARAALVPASPPIVLLMARLSPCGPALGIEHALADAAEYLDDEQVAALRDRTA